MNVQAPCADLVSALTESLSLELAPFNIRTLLVEPGAFGTSFVANAATANAFVPVSPAYKGTAVEQVVNQTASYAGKSPNDVEKGVQRIYEVVMGEGMGKGKTQLLRLPLGKDCLGVILPQFEKLMQNLEAMDEIARSTACDPAT